MDGSGMNQPGRKGDLCTGIARFGLPAPVAAAGGCASVRSLGYGKRYSPGQPANLASTRTTQLYDQKCDDISLDEVEPIRV